MPLVQGDLLHGLGLEDGQDAQHVVHVVDGDAVQQDEVLVRTAAADVKSCESFVSSLHARYQLDGLQDIGLAEDDRSALDMDERNVDGPEVGALDAGVLLGYHHRFPDFGSRGQDDVHGRIPLQVQFHPDAFIADVAVLQGDLPAGDGQGIIAVGVRDGAGRGFPAGLLHQDAGSDQGLAGGPVRDVSAHGGGSAGLSRRGKDGQDGRQQTDPSSHTLLKSGTPGILHQPWMSTPPPIRKSEASAMRCFFMPWRAHLTIWKQNSRMAMVMAPDSCGVTVAIIATVS